MKITITYKVEKTKEIEMTPERYCHYHAHGFNMFLPENRVGDYEVNLTKEAQNELDDFLFNKA